MGQSALCRPTKREGRRRSVESSLASSALAFLVELRNITIATPLERCFYALTFGSYPKSLIGEAQPRAHVRPPQFSFRYETSLEELRSQFLVVQLLAATKSPNVIARKRIPLSSVITGPPHYDYSLEPPHHRISIDITMSQLINLRFHATQMLFELDDLPDKRVCQPSLRLMVG